jgi:hypothetical protein
MKPPSWLWPWDRRRKRLAALCKSVDELGESIEGMRGQLLGIEKELKRLVALVRQGVPNTPPAPAASPARVLSNLSHRPLTGFVEAYNSALRDPDEQLAFHDRYHPLPLGVVNALDRRRAPDTEPVFAVADDGDLFAMPLPVSASQYAVVPRFGLSVHDAQYVPGAFSLLFECGNYKTGSRNLVAALIQPALFDHFSQEDWRFDRKGELELRQE